MRMRPMGFGRLRSLLLGGMWVAAAALAANAIWLTTFAQEPTVRRQPYSSRGAAVAARTPYTVALQESTTSVLGVMKVEGTVWTALRSDGAFVHLYENTRARPIIQRTIMLPSGVTIIVDDVREVKTTARERPGTAPASRMDSTKGCVNNSLNEAVTPGEVVGDGEPIHGYRTIRVASFETTLWLAPDLGCARLKEANKFTAGDRNDKVAISISPGAPDDALFFVPERYRELQPSAYYELEPNSPKARELDLTYFKRRPVR